MVGKCNVVEIVDATDTPGVALDRKKTNATLRVRIGNYLELTAKLLTWSKLR
jgi:hypothetical protein